MADLLRAAKVGVTPKAVNAQLPRKHTNRPSVAALMAFFQAVECIAQERRRHLLKPQGHGGEGEAT